MRIDWKSGILTQVLTKMLRQFGRGGAANRALYRGRRRQEGSAPAKALEVRRRLSAATISPQVSSNPSDTVFPFAVSINQSVPAASQANTPTVTFTATFSEPVAGSIGRIFGWLRQERSPRSL